MSKLASSTQSSTAATTALRSHLNDHLNTTPPQALGPKSVPDHTAHLLHRPSDPLPTQKSRATDYSTHAIERGLPGAIGGSTNTDGRASVVTSGRSGGFGATESGVVLEEEEMPSVGRGGGQKEKARMVGKGTSMEPLKAKEREHEDVDEDEDGGEGTGRKARLGDRIVGATQEVAGKMVGNAPLAEKGHTRKHEGKIGVAVGHAV